jgi:hypothetical protein
MVQPVRIVNFTETWTLAALALDEVRRQVRRRVFWR